MTALSTKALFMVLHFWCVITASVSLRSFESTPTHVNGQLVACVDDQISITCRRDTEIGTGVTVWNVSSPVNCEAIVDHLSPFTIGNCDPFTFLNVSRRVSIMDNIFSSTAVTTANVSISGAVVKCLTSINPLVSIQIGPSIALCIPDQQSPPTNIHVNLMAQGIVQISWDQPTVVCAVSNISYDINLTRTDGNPIDERDTWPVATTETSVTLNLTAGLQYRILITAVNTDCYILSNSIERIFTASLSAVTTTQTPTTSPTTYEITAEQGSTPTGLPQSTVIIIIVVIVVAILILAIAIVIVVVWYYFYKRPKALLEHARPADATVELKSSDVDVLVYDDPNPKVVPHVEAASGDLYAQPEKKSAEHQGVYQDPNSIKHEQAPTGDFYALPQPQQTGTKNKNQVSSVDQESANIAAMYSTVDTSKKSQLTYAQLDVGSGSSGKPVPQSTSYATVVA